jgi:hypothetical protein
MVTNTLSEKRRALCAGIGARWTATVVAVVLSLSGLMLAAIGGDENPANTRMADPAALMSAYDRYVGGARESAVVLSLSNLRGVSSEALNAGGTVSVDLTLGRVTSSVELLPADSSFDLWLIDNRAGPGHTTLAESADVLIRVGTYEACGARAWPSPIRPLCRLPSALTVARLFLKEEEHASKNGIAAAYWNRAGEPG